MVKNMSTAAPLPTAAALADQGRRLIRIAMDTSMIPSAPKNSRTVSKPYIQLINGLFATSGCIPLASYPVNFISPIQPITSTSP